MCKTPRMTALALLVLASPALPAQTPGWFAGIAADGATEDLKKTTSNTTGFSVQLGYEGRIPAAQTAARSTLSYHSFPGKEEAGLKSSLADVQLAGDLLFGLGSSPIRLVTGLSVNRYTQSRSGSPAPGQAWPLEEANGLKFGIRAGLDVPLSPHLAGELLFQLTELGKGPVGGQNPGWVQAGLRWRF